MKWLPILLALVILFSCDKEQLPPEKEYSQEWKKREVEQTKMDSLHFGSTYLPTYSSTFIISKERSVDLTVTVSVRNICSNDTVYITEARYYNTEGKMIRVYLDHPIYLLPLETVEVVIESPDREGGTGDNFVFDWAAKDLDHAPLFEAVMVSTGQQGISFTSRGILMPN